MARYDKYDPISGGFRAVLQDSLSTTATPLGVGMNSSGRVVVGDGNTGVVGVLVVDTAKAAGDVVDVMTSGEVVDCDGLTAGTAYFADATDGSLSTTDTDTPVGHTAEASRLVVRIAS